MDKWYFKLSNGEEFLVTAKTLDEAEQDMVGLIPEGVTVVAKREAIRTDLKD